MVATILLGIYSVSFAYIAKYKPTQWGLKVSFTLIFFFLALRYNFGNDYEAYVDIFTDTAKNDQIDFNYLLVSFYEPGWIILNLLFRHLGFFVMTCALAFFSSVVYYKFITKYVPTNYYWLAIFLYIFNTHFMLIGSSAMRQSVASLFFILSIDYIYKKNFVRYYLCIVLAMLFHFTAIILLPVYLLVYLNQKIRLQYSLILIAIFLSLFVFGRSLAPHIVTIIGHFSSKYADYHDPSEINTGLGFLYSTMLFFTTLYYERMQHRKLALVFKIAVVSFLIIPLPLIIEMAGRLLIYFEPATIIVYPVILSTIKENTSKVIFTSVLVVLTLYQFVIFFYSEIWHDYFFVYQTIFSAPQWY